MQEGDRPGAAGEQLLGLLAAGAGPFPYRSGVHRLLGIPQRGGEVRPPRALPPVGLPYETRAASGHPAAAGPDASGLLASPAPIPIHGARPIASRPAEPTHPAQRNDPSPSSVAAQRAPRAAASTSSSTVAAPSESTRAPDAPPSPVQRRSADSAPASANEAAMPVTTVGLSIPGITMRDSLPARRPAQGGEGTRAADAASTRATDIPRAPTMASTARREPTAPAMPSPAANEPVPPRMVSRRPVAGIAAQEQTRLRPRPRTDAAAPVEALRAATAKRVAAAAPDDRPSAERAHHPAPESPRLAPAAPQPPRVVVVREEPVRSTPRPFWSSSVLRGIHLRVLR